METTNKETRSELWNEIYNIVKQIPRKDVAEDAVDATSATTDIEEMFLKTKTKHVLTNRDISEQYRDIKLYLTISDFTGAFACWATRQITKHKDYSLISSATQSYFNFLSQRYFTDVETVREMDYELISKLTDEDIFIAIPEVMRLNEIEGSDFVCLGALSRNVFYHILRDKITQPL